MIKSKTAAHGSLYTTHSSPRHLEEVRDGRDKRASHGLTDSRLAPGDDEERRWWGCVSRVRAEGVVVGEVECKTTGAQMVQQMQVSGPAKPPWL